jgi:hypothetical protein
MYIGTIAAGWDAKSPIYYVDLDASLLATGTPQLLVDGVGDGWHDGVAVDACGYMYVPDFWSSILFRVDPQGNFIVFHSWVADDNAYGHGAVFGNGIGGWREDAIYLPMPYDDDQVQEIVVGVPSRSWSGSVVNAP